MNKTGKDIGIGIGSLLLALTGLGAAGIGPLAAELGGGTAAAGGAGAAGAGAAGAGGAAAGTGAAATGAGAAGATGAGAAAGAGGTAGTAAGALHPLAESTLGKAAFTSAASMDANAIAHPPTDITTPEGGAKPTQAPTFQQLMSMFPQQAGGMPQLGAMQMGSQGMWG